MGIFDFFSKSSKEGRFLKKQISQVQDKRAMSPDRMQALQELREAISEATLGLFRRFDFQYDKSIEDEQEKEWVHQTLVDLGPGIVPDLRIYLQQTSSFSWPLKILGEVAKGKALQETIQALCEQNNNSYVRDPSKKIQLLSFLGEHKDSVLASLILPYLEDMDEGVRFTAVEALLHQADVEVALAPLVKLLKSDEEQSRRIKLRILQGLAQLGWMLSKEQIAGTEKLVADLAPGSRIDAQGKIHLKS